MGGGWLFVGKSQVGATKNTGNGGIGIIGNPW